MNTENHKGDRIAKVIARVGLCSRRDAERWIEAGRVKVNGETITSPALNVRDEDDIAVDNKPLPRKEQTRLFLYHKPAGLVTSHKDEQGRETVFDTLPQGLPRLLSVGRLDLNTEGLLLLTNDGELSRYLELPATGWSRRYRVRVLGNVSQDKLDRLKKGVTVEGVRYKPIKAVLESQKDAANRWVHVTLHEGKNREIRRVMEYLNLQVNRLIRIGYGPFELGKIPKGAVLEVKQDVLRQQVKPFFENKS